MARLLGRDRAYDARRLAGLVALAQPGDGSATPFAGIKRLLPGYCATLWRDGRLTLAQASLPSLGLGPMSPSDWAHALRYEIARATQRMTCGAKRVSVLLSGGIDSSAVLAALINSPPGASERDISALTLDFDAPRSDRPYVSAIARKLGVEPVRVQPSECAHLAGSTFVMDGMPRVWPSTAGDVHLLDVARERGTDVLLTGVGGDFYWDGETDSLAEQAMGGRVVSAVRDAIALKGAYWQASPYRRVKTFVARPVFQRLVPTRMWRSFRAARWGSGAYTPSWAGRELREVYRERLARVDAQLPVQGRSGRMRELAVSPVLSSIAEDVENIETEVGCREEHVFLDSDLARFMASVPSHVVLHGGWLRGLVREAFKDDWPDEIRLRADKGDFEPAFSEYMRGLRASGILPKLLEMQGLGDLGIIEPQAFRREFEPFGAGYLGAGAWGLFWPALAVEAFVSGLSQPRQGLPGHARRAA
ncbi:MAG: asparagine synthase-related protein [Polyangiaceae bacterium]